MGCIYCEIIQKRERAAVLYEDNELLVAVKDKVLVPGQITVFTKEHLPIMEMVHDEILQRCAVLANKASISVFESLGCKGTNIIVQNGLSAGQTAPHFGIEVIPRQENDGLNLQWLPKQLMEDEMETAYLMLSDEIAKLVDIGKKSEQEKSKAESKEEMPRKMVAEKGKKNYLLKSLRRIP